MCVVLEERVEIVVHYFGNIIVGSNKNDWAYFYQLVMSSYCPSLGWLDVRFHETEIKTN